MAESILIIDDEESIRASLKGALEDEGFDVITAEDGESGITRTSEELPDLILLDIWMPGIDGIETLNRLKRLYPKLPIIIMSGHGTIEAAVKATKLGAYDFIEKPLSIEKVILGIGRALETSRLMQENLILKGDERHLIIGKSEAISKLKEDIESAAQSKAPVLLTGENGTGKEVVAWNIHNRSLRANKPFVTVNCAAIPEELMECELFGYEKGAFTGATSRQKGRFDIAHEGTLFLNGVGDISLSTQAKVLRIIQEMVFERVGGTKGIKVDVRVIAATSHTIHPSSLILHPSFLIHIPPLRERVGDIRLLAEHFINEFSRESGRPSKKVSPEAMSLLKRYDWPGNVRELRNLIERLVTISPSRLIEPHNLPPYLTGPAEGPIDDAFSTLDFKEARRLFEKEFIIRKMEENGWNISKTAEAMGIERSHLHRKIKSYGIEIKEL
ncbi:MAG: sigma-54-dependent Fis family transcriptional regulator [Deltaproteobacteria bacterium]|nr:sigma-54-dependent Fis family transcriptional regulator [Deltaproteobacteria bacterium]